MHPFAVIPGDRSGAKGDPGPIGPNVVAHGRVLMVAHARRFAFSEHPAALVNGSRVSLRSPGMTRVFGHAHFGACGLEEIRIGVPHE
jgi:hypothetical protein